MKKILAWFGKVFRPKNSESQPNGANINAFQQNVPTSDINLSITGIEWIDNDGLLRDEGVLFGIARADKSEKLDAIRNGFEKAKAPFEITRQQLLDRVQHIQNKKEQHFANTANMRVEILELRNNPVKSEHKFIPAFFQLLAYVAISYFNYYLLSFWMRPVFEENSFMTIGLYCFGMLSVYMGRALVYNSNSTVQEGDDHQNKREKWKIWLEEFGVPCVVAAFITVLCARTYPVEWSVVAFFLFFFLFSFSGKGMINSIYRCHKEAKQFLAYWKQVRAKNKEIRRKADTVKTNESDAKDLEKQLQEAFEKLEIPDTKLSQLNALLAYKINIFESEYLLSSNAQSEFTAKQKASLQF